MLRASSDETEPDLDVVTRGADENVEGVLCGKALIRLAEAVHGSDEGAMAKAREAVVEALGAEAMVDAVAVAAHFNAITRIADSTGIQLDRGLEASSAEIRERLGINAFDTTAPA